MGRHRFKSAGQDHAPTPATPVGQAGVAGLEEDSHRLPSVGLGDESASQVNAANDDDGAMTVKVADVRVPLCDEPLDGYRPRQINLLLDATQAEAMRRAAEALEADGAKLKGGKRVRTSAHAVEWVIDQIVATMGGTAAGDSAAETG